MSDRPNDQNIPMDINSLTFDSFPRDSQRDVVCLAPIRSVIRREEEIVLVRKVRKVEEIDAGLTCPTSSLPIASNVLVQGGTSTVVTGDSATYVQSAQTGVAQPVTVPAMQPETAAQPETTAYQQPATVQPTATDYQAPATAQPVTADYQRADLSGAATVHPTGVDYQQPTVVAAVEGSSVLADAQIASPEIASEDLIVHSQRNCFLIEQWNMDRLQSEVAVSRVLQPGTYTIRIKSGTFNYRTDSGHQGEPLCLLWVYGGKVINQKTGVAVGATWSSLNGYGDSLVLEVLEPATICGFYFDTYLDDNDGAVTVSIEGSHPVEDMVVHSKYNCYFIDPDSLRRLEQETGVSKTLQPGVYTLKIKSGSFNYHQDSGHAGEPLLMLWIYGGVVINHKTWVTVAATWSSLNGYDDVMRLEVREPATVCAFFFDTQIDDNSGEVVLSIDKAYRNPR
jgi:hypothetical protein